MKITGNELATPLLDSENNWIVDGLTIRQQFSMAAMQGLIANAPNGHLSNSKEGVLLAIQWSDDLIKALNETPNPNA